MLKYKRVMLFLSIFALVLIVALLQQNSKTGEVAKIIKLENSSILIMNEGGRERSIKVSQKDLANLDINKTYFLEYQSFLGEKPHLLSYQLMPENLAK